MKNKILLLFLLTASCYLSCTQENKRHKVPEAVLEEKFILPIYSFHDDLFALQNDTAAFFYKNIAAKYPDFFYLFTQRIINIGDSTNPQMANLLKGFLKDRYIREMYAEVKKQFPQLDPYNKQLTDAFKGYRYFFPKAKIPAVIYFVSGYNYTNITTETTLGIGLEMYLGNRYQPYTYLEIPRYKQQIMQKEYLVSDALQVWISTEFEEKEDYASLLSQMLYKGKIIYLTKKLLPEVPDSVVFGYSKAQLNWCESNEAAIWKNFIDKKVLFGSLRGDSNKYINEGPFTAGFPRESPGKLGVWVGYQIIKKLTDQKADISVSQLFEMRNAEQILSQSKYKPK